MKLNDFMPVLPPQQKVLIRYQSKGNKNLRSKTWRDTMFEHDIEFFNSVIRWVWTDQKGEDILVFTLEEE